MMIAPISRRSIGDGESENSFDSLILLEREFAENNKKLEEPPQPTKRVFDKNNVKELKNYRRSIVERAIQLNNFLEKQEKLKLTSSTPRFTKQQQQQQQQHQQLRDSVLSPSVSAITIDENESIPCHITSKKSDKSHNSSAIESIISNLWKNKTLSTKSSSKLQQSLQQERSVKDKSEIDKKSDSVDEGNSSIQKLSRKLVNVSGISTNNCVIDRFIEKLDYLIVAPKYEHNTTTTTSNKNISNKNLPWRLRRDLQDWNCPIDSLNRNSSVNNNLHKNLRSTTIHQKKSFVNRKKFLKSLQCDQDIQSDESDNDNCANSSIINDDNNKTKEVSPRKYILQKKIEDFNETLKSIEDDEIEKLVAKNTERNKSTDQLILNLSKRLNKIYDVMCETLTQGVEHSKELELIKKCMIDNKSRIEYIEGENPHLIKSYSTTTYNDLDKCSEKTTNNDTEEIIIIVDDKSEISQKTDISKKSIVEKSLIRKSLQPIQCFSSATKKSLTRDEKSKILESDINEIERDISEHYSNHNILEKSVENKPQTKINCGVDKASQVTINSIKNQSKSQIIDKTMIHNKSNNYSNKSKHSRIIIFHSDSESENEPEQQEVVNKKPIVILENVVLVQPNDKTNNLPLENHNNTNKTIDEQIPEIIDSEDLAPTEKIDKTAQTSQIKNYSKTINKTTLNKHESENISINSSKIKSKIEKTKEIKIDEIQNSKIESNIEILPPAISINQSDRTLRSHTNKNKTENKSINTTTDNNNKSKNRSKRNNKSLQKITDDEIKNKTKPLKTIIEYNSDNNDNDDYDFKKPTQNSIINSNNNINNNNNNNNISKRRKDFSEYGAIEKTIEPIASSTMNHLKVDDEIIQPKEVKKKERKRRKPPPEEVIDNNDVVEKEPEVRRSKRERKKPKPRYNVQCLYFETSKDFNSFNREISSTKRPMKRKNKNMK